MEANDRTTLLDSVILIDYLNGIPDAIQYVDDTSDERLVSIVTSAEVLTGVEEEGRTDVVGFLDTFPLLIVNRRVAVRTARLRREHG